MDEARNMFKKMIKYSIFKKIAENCIGDLRKHFSNFFLKNSLCNPSRIGRKYFYYEKKNNFLFGTKISKKLQLNTKIKSQKKIYYF